MSKSYFETLVDEYINSGDLENLYINHINKFRDYIKHIDKENSILDITYKDLDKSVGYQNKLGNINTVNSMSNHLESIKSFFNFLHKKRVHQNVFRDIPDYSNFKDELVKKYNLTEEINRDALPEDALIDLLKLFDSDVKFKNDELGYSNSNLIIKIFIKMTLIAPAKKQVICSLKFSDFIEDFRKVYINSVLIRIPNYLRADMMDALKNAIGINEKMYKEDDIFFDYICTHIKFSETALNRALYYALKDIGYDGINKNKGKRTQTYSTEAVMNTALVSLFKNNTNPFLIAKINGTSPASLQKKMEQLGVKVVCQDDLINSAIASTIYYQYI